jgi:hypothetical protein
MDAIAEKNAGTDFVATNYTVEDEYRYATLACESQDLHYILCEENDADKDAIVERIAAIQKQMNYLELLGIAQ